MENSVEKSCWGVTVWAVAVAVGLVLLVSFVTGADTSSVVAVTPVVN